MVHFATKLAMSAAKKQKLSQRAVTSLNTDDATLLIDLAGGSIASFSFKESLNPLSWDSAIHDQLDVSSPNPRPLGHFLCLDRWGPPSLAEEAHGMPYHGEASGCTWQLEATHSASARLAAELPRAGLRAVRRVELLKAAALGDWKETMAALLKVQDEVGPLSFFFFVCGGCQSDMK